MMIKKWIRATLTALCVMIGTTAFAYSDDVGIMDRFNYDNSMYMYDYLNSNDYRFVNHFNAGTQDGYMKNDNSMFMVLANKSDYPIQPGQMNSVIILKPGIFTDKGIQVGDTLQKLINTYGKVYERARSDIYNNDLNTGYYYKEGYSYLVRGKTHGFKYYSIIYFDREQRQIQFLVNQSSREIVAIRYWRYNPYDINPSGVIGRYGLWRYIVNY